MTFEPMGRVIHSLQEQQTWREYRQFQTLLQVWETVVGKAVAAQTRLLWLTPQRVLKVATSSGVWAQNLTFERHRILAKLNQALNLNPPLTDLQFSTRQWQLPSLKNSFPQTDQQSNPTLWAGGRRPVNPLASSPATCPTQPLDPETAFQNWSNTLKRRDRHLPLCRQCQCPTPAAELERWSICALCSARQGIIASLAKTDLS
jgi:predicted nucleic acid-binding Zn ribbon protein